MKSTIRNLVLMYIKYHPECTVRDVHRDMDINYDTICTSVHKALEDGSCDAPRNQLYRKSYTLKIEPNNDMLNYLLSIIRKHRNLTKAELTAISGAAASTVNKYVTRMKNLNRAQVDGHKLSWPPKPKRGFYVEC